MERCTSEYSHFTTLFAAEVVYGKYPFDEMIRRFPDTLFFGYSKAQMQKLVFIVLQAQCRYGIVLSKLSGPGGIV